MASPGGVILAPFGAGEMDLPETKAQPDFSAAENGLSKRGPMFFSPAVREPVPRQNLRLAEIDLPAAKKCEKGKEWQGVYQTIKWEGEERVAWIRLNRPEKMNAMNGTMQAELMEAIKRTKRDEKFRCLVITGEGRAFCSGADLTEMGKDLDYGEILRTAYNPLILELQSLEIPVIAAVNGAAAGAGFSLALACDLRVVHESASFHQAFVHIGLIPDAGNLYFLPRMIGYAKAMELSLLGEAVSAEKAVELGLASRVIPAASWEKEIRDFAEKVASLPTRAIALMKHCLQKTFETPLPQMLEYEAAAQKAAGRTADHREGIRAFLEKRKARFSGR